MDESAIAQYILNGLPNVQTSENFGYQFFFFGDDHRMPFATIASSDNDYDRVSDLDRPGVFRLNIGISKESFQALFAPSAEYDYTELDRFMPHPDYARQFFVCILSPSEANLATVHEMLVEAHGIAERRYKLRSQG